MWLRALTSLHYAVLSSYQTVQTYEADLLLLAPLTQVSKFVTKLAPRYATVTTKRIGGSAGTCFIYSNLLIFKVRLSTHTHTHKHTHALPTTTRRAMEQQA